MTPSEMKIHEAREKAETRQRKARTDMFARKYLAIRSVVGFMLNNTTSFCSYIHYQYMADTPDAEQRRFYQDCIFIRCNTPGWSSSRLDALSKKITGH